MKREFDKDRAWGVIQGLMFSIAIMHAEQPVAVIFGDLDMKAKIWIALCGGALYSTTAIGLYLRARWALWISMIGPLVGLTSVMLIRADVDTFQVMCGIAQFYAAIIAFNLLTEK